MALMRSRSLWIGVGLLLFLSSGTAMAAGCNTTCSFSFPTRPYPCLTCDYTAFSMTSCIRTSCDSCDAESCSVSMPSKGDLWASSDTRDARCSLPGNRISALKIVRVERLPSRS